MAERAVLSSTFEMQPLPCVWPDTPAHCVYPLELLEDDGVLSGRGLRGNLGPGGRVREVREDDDDATRMGRFALEGTRTGGALVLKQVFPSGEVRGPFPSPSPSHSIKSVPRRGEPPDVEGEELKVLFAPPSDPPWQVVTCEFGRRA